MILETVEFIEGPSCGHRLRTSRVREEYVSRDKYLYVVDGSSPDGKLRAWYAGEVDCCVEAD